MAKKTKHTAPERHGYEFLGPPGAFAISFGLPILAYFFVFVCNDVTGCPAPSLSHPSSFSLSRFRQEVGWPQQGIRGLFSWEATWASLAYYALNLVLHRLLPGTEAKGTVLRNGNRLTYKFNTLPSAAIILVALGTGTMINGADFIVWTFISDNYIQILSANLLICYSLATACYISSFSINSSNIHTRELAAGGQSGNILYDWFIGRELNPRVNIPFIGVIDIKIFIELRPGMMGWAILNCAWCAQQYRNFGYLSDSIILVTLSQALYIIDSWWNEPAILTTIDIIMDGFGVMLAFGNMIWVPFVYSLQGRYLSYHPVSMGPYGTLAVLTIIGTGFLIFRLSNNQKDVFRNSPDHPSVAHLKFIQTSNGGKLLITGWWGVARHVNYLADWFQAWGYCLPTGLAGYHIRVDDSLYAGSFAMRDGRQVVPGCAKGWAIPITYFYVIYFAVLLLHRERRDDAKCEQKYGEDWRQYKKIVRYRVIPWIY